jgi:hypothetical protein
MWPTSAAPCNWPGWERPTGHTSSARRSSRMALCFDVDGTLTITLQSNGSTISAPLIGLFCPRPSATGHQHGGAVSCGNPFVEDDSIAFTSGTGQFDGLSGTASFHTFSAGARFTGTLKGTLSG